MTYLQQHPSNPPPHQPSAVSQSVPSSSIVTVSNPLQNLISRHAQPQPHEFPSQHVSYSHLPPSSSAPPQPINSRHPCPVETGSDLPRSTVHLHNAPLHTSAAPHMTTQQPEQTIPHLHPHWAARAPETHINASSHCLQQHSHHQHQPHPSVDYHVPTILMSTTNPSVLPVPPHHIHYSHPQPHQFSQPPPRSQEQPVHHAITYTTPHHTFMHTHSDKHHLYQHPLNIVSHPSHDGAHPTNPHSAPYVYPVHHHLVAPVAHVPVGAAHYAHLPPSYWAPHNQYHPPVAPPSHHPSTIMPPVHPHPSHPQHQRPFPQHFMHPTSQLAQQESLHQGPMQQGPPPPTHYSYAYPPVPSLPPQVKDNHSQAQIQHGPVPHSTSDPVIPPPGISATLHVSAPMAVITPKFEISHPPSPAQVLTSQFVEPVPPPSLTSCPPCVSDPQPNNQPQITLHPSQNVKPSTEKKTRSPTEEPQFRTQEGSPQKQLSDTDSVPSQKLNNTSSDEKLPGAATKTEPLLTQDSRSDVQNSKLSNALRDQPIQKPRKPYTITKSREVWSKEEHARFLSALQLYDRDWKKIELYIGTKTVLQIRSHAQKHFGKVTKYKTGEYIPPPRPKKRAALPYPRSCPTTPTKTAASTGGTSAEGEPDGLEEAIAESKFGRGTSSDSATGNDRGYVCKLERVTQNRDDIFPNRISGSEAQDHDECSVLHDALKTQPFNLDSKGRCDSANSKSVSDGTHSRAFQEGMIENCCRASHRADSSEQIDEDSEVKNNHLRREKNVGSNILRCGPQESKTNIGERGGKNASEDRSSCGKRASASSNDGAPSTKRQALEGSHALDIGRLSTEAADSRVKEDDVDQGLDGANNSLLVLSDCVDMMSREDNTKCETGQTRWQSRSLVNRAKVARARSSIVTSIDGNENKGTGYRHTAKAKSSTQVTVRAILQPTHNETGNSPGEMRNQQRRATRSDAQPGSPPAEIGDRNNENLRRDPQRSSVGSGSISDDPMAGLTCSDRPSVSDNGLGSSYAESGSGGSVDSSRSGEGEEDPKSGNEGSGDDVIRQGISSRGSSPADPNSSVSREVSPNGNCSAGGEEGNRPESNERSSKQKDQKGVVKKISSVTGGRKPSMKSDIRRNDSLCQKTKQNVRSVPISKTIAHLINDLEELECSLEYKLSQRSRPSEEGRKSSFQESVRLECDEAPESNERVAKNEVVGKGWLKQKKRVDS